MEIKIAIAEDHSLFRKGIIPLLNSFVGFQVIADAENGAELLKKYRKLARDGEAIPDISILDLNMPEMVGFKSTLVLRKHFPSTKIIIISAHDDADIIVHLYDKGANAFLDKNAEPEEVELAIRSVMKNDFYFNNDAKIALEDTNSDNKNTVYLDLEDALSNRDIELLKLICQEKTASEIAEELALSKRTVDNYRNRLLQKTRSKNITGLVLFAVRAGIISVSELKINTL